MSPLTIQMIGAGELNKMPRITTVWLVAKLTARKTRKYTPVPSKIQQALNNSRGRTRGQLPGMVATASATPIIAPYPRVLKAPNSPTTDPDLAAML